MRLSHLFALPVATAAVLALGISSASAGEVTGNGKVTGSVANSNSECSFSGQEDGSEGGPSGPGVAPQNWGQIPQADRAFLTSIGVSPGTLCNGHLSPRK